MEGIAVFIFNGSIFALVVTALIFSIKSHIRKERTLKKWVLDKGFNYLGPEPHQSWQSLFNTRQLMSSSDLLSQPQGLLLSTYSRGSLYRGFKGQLPGTGNRFTTVHQTEERGSGKNKKTYSRTITIAEIPDTRLQLLVNSKLNNDARSGGNFEHYNKIQRHRLEGNFGEYFEVYLPNATQSEALSLLAPDSMHYIMTDLADYDIEVNGSYLFIYTYHHIFDPAELDKMLVKLEILLAEFRLRPEDTSSPYAATARSAASELVDHRALQKKRWTLKSTISLLLMIAAFMIGPIFFAYYMATEPHASIALSDRPILIALAMFITMLGSVVFAIWQFARSHRLKKRYKETIRHNHQEKQA